MDSAAASGETGATAMKNNPLQVAVVDDDESLRRSFGRLLRAAGICSVMYPSAEAFLADREQPPFDCLVLDVRLGGMSGIELGLWLAAEGATAPIIFVTAYDEAVSRKLAERAGCVGYFRKTDSGDAVLEAIRRVAA
jgi:FixJ family two-component response regulator